MAPEFTDVCDVLATARTASFRPASASWRALAESPARREDRSPASDAVTTASVSVLVTSMITITRAMLPRSSRRRVSSRRIVVLAIVPKGGGAEHVELCHLLEGLEVDLH